MSRLQHPLRLPPLRTLQAFEAVTRTGSFRAAAEDLHVTVSAVSHRVRHLEELLEVRLFDRSRRGVSLTEAGRRLRGGVEQAFRLLQDGVLAATRTGSARVLSVHAPPTFASLFLMPRLGAFLAGHPSVAVRVWATPEMPDPRTEFDLEVRYGRPPWPDVASEPLLPEPIVPLVAPRLIESLGRPMVPDDLRTLTLIHSEVNLLGWDDWLRAAGVAWRPVGRVLRFDRSVNAIRAAADGLGVAFDSAAMAEEFLRRGELLAPFALPRFPLTAEGHHLVRRSDAGLNPDTEHLAGWLRTEARATLDRVRVLLHGSSDH